MSTSGQEKELHLRESETGPGETTNPRVKPPPKSGQERIPVPFSYIPSDDGTDENLLILLHGLGDTHEPFAKLGKQLKLPQTAALVLRAPERIPWLYEEAYQWYTSFDPVGEPLTNPNPTSALVLMDKIVTYLATQCKWPLDRIHWFGFGQGGTVAVEFGLWWWKEKQLLAAKKSSSSSPATGSSTANTTTLPTTSFGSVVTVGGPLLSFPTVLSSLSPTTVLAVSRASPSTLAFTSSDVSAFKRGFRAIKEEKYKKFDAGMPASRDEWEPIMRFWSERLLRRIGGSGLYEVLSGAS
ncbi:hypothetical protein P691DRAFT_719724 [Macrolepiota fuliginosa MF-IS2]|uniref:Phospholipase/carboxylesterase/thioesterase domain-containing protein n=1 Tax=Macrolepiota fuliginosa MF-IS2 TaxID=1400762 RepID=A0A9P5XM62_9AGAR|nr:hypothetical protein P691DRAFT_719724 [Macrolepiota fuliginosa MF-IS2]